MQDNYATLVSLLLPDGILEYFEITDTGTDNEGLKIYLEEKNTAPQGYTNSELQSKGFYDQVKVQDFPIRGKKAYLYVKRRRWEVIATGSIVSRDWKLIQSGTRMTKEFAAFLKEVFG